jgi:hypothetical protein
VAVTNMDGRWATTCTLALALCAGCTDGLTVGAVARPSVSVTVDAAVDVTPSDAAGDPENREAAVDSPVGAVLAFVSDCVGFEANAGGLEMAYLVVTNLGDQATAPLVFWTTSGLVIVEQTKDCAVGQLLQPHATCSLTLRTAPVMAPPVAPSSDGVIVSDGRARACATVSMTCVDGGTMSDNDGAQRTPGMRGDIRRR